MKIENPENSTIVALSTPVGGALCVVRLSGNSAEDIISKHFRGELKERVATFGVFRDVAGEVIDEVVVTYFASGRSFTGEAMVEVSCHGSSWIASEIVAQCIGSGAVAATAGEFSKRAFLNGKIDLSQAEAIADLIASDSKASARVAMQQIRGGYSAEFSALRAELLSVMALLELELDFGEEDVEFADREQLVVIVKKIMGRVEQLRESFRLGNVLKNGIPVAIVGAPNVGKSTLLNRLVGEQRAIVSSVAGTTRDYIEAQVSIDGVMFRFIDTAGLRDTDCDIENQGIERSKEQLSRASIVVHLRDGSPSDEVVGVSANQSLIEVYNKVDLREELSICEICPEGSIKISAKYGDGVEELKRRLVEAVGFDDMLSAGDIVVSNARHYDALCRSSDDFVRALGAIECGLSGELVASELHQALSNIASITGEITTDNILSEIFANHCIGK